LKVSIVTVVYNNADTISSTIESVLSQKYTDVEYIIVDGQSTDGTIEVIKEYAQQIDVFVSEKDDGLYDAINKGIAMATGEVVGILHADDIFDSTQAISEVVKAFKDQSVDCVYADLKYVDRDDTDLVIRDWKSGMVSKKKFNKGWMPPHPTFYARKSCFEQNGGYDTSFKCSADYELMLRFLYKNELKAAYVNKSLVRMRMGGVSNCTLKGRIKANKEDAMAWVKNELNPNPLFRIMKPMRKLGQLNLKPVGLKAATYFSLIAPILLLIGFFNNFSSLSSSVIVAASTIFSWGIVIVSVPVVIQIARVKHLMDNPNNRSSHKNPIPTLGGVAIFASLALSLTVWMGFNETNNLQYLLSALTVIFFIGLKDDMLVISPTKKLVAQIIASLLIIRGLDLQLDSFYGIFGISDLHSWVSIPLTLIIFVLITNAYNLIDGIDGLASTMGSITAAVLGVWFLLAGHIEYAILSFSMLGALIAFLKFNFSKSKKIFLGDTGSLIIGIVCATIVFKFIKLNAGMIDTQYYIHNAPVVAIAILGITVFDLLRVFTVRIFRKGSPFVADRNHIHHLLIDLDFTHKNATFIIATLNLVFIAVTLIAFSGLNPTAGILMMVLSFLFHIILCHQLQFSNPREIKLIFFRYVRLFNGKRIIKTIART